MMKMAGLLFVAATRLQAAKGREDKLARRAIRS